MKYRIEMVLPPPQSAPTGGYKVQYEAANVLASLGHDVGISYTRSISLRTWKGRALDRLTAPGNSDLRPGWFDLADRVTARFLSRRSLRDADIVLATSTSTIHAVHRLRPDAFAVVYEYEFWATADAQQRQRMADAFRLVDGRLLATSPAVVAMLDEMGLKTRGYIGTGIGAGFRPSAENRRCARTVLMPFSTVPEKASVDGVAALALVRASRPELNFVAFGPPVGRRFLPKWISYVTSPTDAELVELLHTATLFVYPSRYEGFGLPGLEAMACGCPVVTADSVGNREYARHEQTAIVVEREEPNSLAEAVMELLDDPTRRSELSANGVRLAAEFTTAAVVDALLRMVGVADADEGRSDA